MQYYYIQIYKILINILSYFSTPTARDNNKWRGSNGVGGGGEELIALNESPATPYDPHAHRNVEHPTT